MISALRDRLNGRRIASSRLAQNVAALYGVQFGRKIIPLISVPYLARVLGPLGWGKVAFVTAVAEFLVILIEFGFNLSATREIARNRECPRKCGEVMAGVLGAQALLAVLGVTLALTVAQWIPLLRENPALLLGGMVYGVCQGFAPIWFFQGLERIRLSSALEVGGKTAALCGLFVFVHSPADGWKVMALAGIAPAVTTVAALLLACQNIPMRRPTPALVGQALHMGWPMFVFRSAESLYGVGNSFLLGLFAGPVVVGYFAAAEKISRAAHGLLIPIRDAVYPRLSHLAKQGRDAAAPLARLGAMAMIGGGLALGAGLFASAPWLIRWLLGGAFQPAVAVLRILSALPVLLSITNSVGIQWLLPFGRDGAINRSIIAAGVLNVALSVVLAPRFAHIGMAWAVVLSEAFVCASLTFAALRTTESSAPACLAAET
jgi:PST family polysaccharide transporter